jgi:hypothetical protein
MTDQQPTAPAPETAKAPEEWKPEPRTWTWRDLFTAPMLAFKPKCMAISALTLVVLGLWAHLFTVLAPDLGSWVWPVWAGFLLVGLVIFGLGASLVAVFMKADLLDDEFLSFGEAFGQFRTRLLAAVMVPVFLAVLVAGVHALLVWLPMFVGSIPYAGGALYALLYPLGFFAAIFAILMAIAAVFGLFVFPAIVAIRRHGWFDNVVDTIEAVGTRPHVLIGSLALSLAMIYLAYLISFGAMSYLRGAAESQPTWGAESGRADPARVEDRAREISERALRWIDPIAAAKVNVRAELDAREAPSDIRDAFGMREESDGYYKWGPGLIAGFWQTIIGALVLGYCLNLFIGGGMLTYLVVREDDYWDDEDLEDLDKLAKELEEEAKREEAGQAPAAQPTTPPTQPAAAPAQPGPADGTVPTQVVPPKG